MELYYMPNNNHKIFHHNKNDIFHPNQLRNYNHNSSPAIQISPIKSQNFNKYKFIDEKDSFYNMKKDNNYNNFFNNFKKDRIDGNLTSKQKNISVDYDNKSVNFNNKKLKYSYSYSNIIQDNKNKLSSNLFEYSNNINNIQISNKNNNDFYNTNQINNKKDNFWNNDDIKDNNNNNDYIFIKTKSSSFFDDKNNNNELKDNNVILRNNFLINENNIKKNNNSLNSYKYYNSNNYKYLFDYSPNNNNNNNNNFLKNDNYNNNLSLHDKYISPDYIDALKSKNFYSSSINKEEKPEFFFKSLNKFQNYINYNRNINNPQIKSLTSKNKNNNTPTKISYNSKNIIKNEQNYKDNLLNYILKNSELFKKLIDNILLKKNNTNNNILLNYALPKKSNININKKTLLLDLDETLVHSSFKPYPVISDINFNIYLQNNSLKVNVLVRPYVQEFLEKMSKLYEIIIFTASVPQYANPLLDILDKNRYIIHRLYRQHCITLYGLFIKDLRTIGRDLKNTIILDNNPISYLLNQENGIPIKSWHSDKTDKELIKLIPLLEYLSRNEVSDVREIIKKVVINNTIEYNLVNAIILKNYNNNENNKKKYVRTNSISNFNKNRNNFLTPKKDKNILINNYYKNESYNKKDKERDYNNNNININIINFNISKVIMNDVQKNKINIKLKDIPISNKLKKNKKKLEYIQEINNIYSSKNNISKESIESLINSKYKYLGHLINEKKQNKINKIYNQGIRLNKSLINYKRQFSQNIMSSSSKKGNNENNNISNNTQNKKYDRKEYINRINEYQINHTLKNLYDLPNRKTENNIINKQNGSYLYNNYINYDTIKKGEYIMKKLNYHNLPKNYNLFNDINLSDRNDELNIYNKINKRASTPSVTHHYAHKNNRDFNKEFINYNYNPINYVY